MENNKKKSYFIIKNEPNQDGGFTPFIYTPQRMFRGDPSAVGLYASPMRNPPSSLSPGSVEIARSIGQIKGKPNLTKTISGNVLGSTYPGTVTLPNRPFVAMAPRMGPRMASSCCPQSPCEPPRSLCDDKQKVGVIGPTSPCSPRFSGPIPVGPFRKGEPTPGLFGWSPFFQPSMYGVSSTQTGTMVLIIENKRYKVSLPYEKIRTVNEILAKHRCNSSRRSFRIGLLVPSLPQPFSWNDNCNNVDVLIDVFNAISGDDKVKFEDESTGKELSKEDFRKDLYDYIKKLKASLEDEQNKKTEAQKKRDEDAKKKLEESEEKLSGAKVEDRKAEDKKESAPLATGLNFPIIVGQRTFVPAGVYPWLRQNVGAVYRPWIYPYPVFAGGGNGTTEIARVVVKEGEETVYIKGKVKDVTDDEIAAFLKEYYEILGTGSNPEFVKMKTLTEEKRKIIYEALRDFFKSKGM